MLLAGAGIEGWTLKSGSSRAAQPAGHTATAAACPRCRRSIRSRCSAQTGSHRRRGRGAGVHRITDDPYRWALICFGNLDAVVGLSCRLYRSAQGTTGPPSIEQLTAALGGDHVDRARLTALILLPIWNTLASSSTGYWTWRDPMTGADRRAAPGGRTSNCCFTWCSAT